MSLLRPTALITAGALSVHELRYALAGGQAPDPAGGHGYLPLATVLTAVLLALACAHLLRRVIGARRGEGAEPAGPRLLTTWLAAVTALLAIFVAQELLEGLLATGGAHGPGPVFASGGWIAAPLAVGLGAVIAVALTVARAAVAAAARAARRSPTQRPRAAGRPRTAAPAGRRRSVLAAHRAWRAPPAAS